MGFNGLIFPDRSHYLSSEFCGVVAANLLIECDLCKCRFFGANCGLEFIRGICDAIGILYGD